MNEVKRALTEAMIKIAEISNQHEWPSEQLDKIDKVTAVQLGHATGIMDACNWLRHKIAEPVE